MQNRKCLTQIFLICIFMFFAVNRLNADDIWQRIPVITSGEIIPELKAIGIRGSVEENGKKLNAYVIIRGRKESNIFNLNIVMEEVYDIVPIKAIEEFRGPDLPEHVIKQKALEICVSCGKTEKRFDTRMTMQGCMYPKDICGKVSECFCTNIKINKKEGQDWLNYINVLQKGFEEGYVVIGKGHFPRSVKVKFTGKGIEPLMKELMAFVAKSKKK